MTQLGFCLPEGCDCTLCKTKRERDSWLAESVRLKAALRDVLGCFVEGTNGIHHGSAHAVRIEAWTKLLAAGTVGE